MDFKILEQNQKILSKMEEIKEENVLKEGGNKEGLLPNMNTIE